MYYVGAGPCTEMCFLENAAQAICDAASGREFSAMSASAKGSALDKTTGMEARFAGKTLQAASGMRVEDANYLLDSIVGLYEGNTTIPEGYRFQDCYDLNTLEPTNFHQEIYSLTADKLRSLGLDIRDRGHSSTLTSTWSPSSRLRVLLRWYWQMISMMSA